MSHVERGFGADGADLAFEFGGGSRKFFTPPLAQGLAASALQDDQFKWFVDTELPRREMAVKRMVIQRRATDGRRFEFDALAKRRIERGQHARDMIVHTVVVVKVAVADE